MSLKGFGIFSGFYGDGSDGQVLVTGTLSLQRDMNYRDLILSGTAAGPPVIITNSFRVNVRDKLIFLTSGTFDCSGGNGSAGAGGSVPRPVGASGSLAALGDGGNSGVPSISFPGYGGSGGGGGSVLTPDPVSGSIDNLVSAMLGYTFGYAGVFQIAGGTGGTGGTLGGGAGGGVMIVCARTIQMGYSGTFITTSSLASPGLPFSGSVAPFSGTVYTRIPSQTGTFKVSGGNGGGTGGGGGGGVLVLVSSERPTLTGAFGSLSGTHVGLSASLTLLPEMRSGTIAVNVAAGTGGTGTPHAGQAFILTL